jgi:uncharacterized membrane protein
MEETMTEKFFPDEHDEHEPRAHVPAEPPDREPLPTMETSGGEHNDRSRRTTDDARMMAIMSYIPFLCFVPLLNMKHDRNAQFHARQGTILFLIEIVAVLLLIHPVSDFVFRAVLLIAIAFSIAGIYFGLQGKNHKLPIIGDLAEKTDL